MRFCTAHHSRLTHTVPDTHTAHAHHIARGLIICALWRVLLISVDILVGDLKNPRNDYLQICLVELKLYYVLK